MTEEFMKFIDRYVEVWNEPDAAKPRRTIEALWVPGGANYTPSTEATSYQALQDRVTSAYEAYVRSGKLLGKLLNAERPGATAWLGDAFCVPVVQPLRRFSAVLSSSASASLPGSFLSRSGRSG